MVVKIFHFLHNKQGNIIMHVNIIPDRKSALIYCQKRFSQQAKIKHLKYWGSLRRRKTKNGVARAKKIKITDKGASYLIKDIMKKKKKKKKKRGGAFSE